MRVSGLERVHAISEWVFYRSVAEHNLGLTDHKIKASEARILRARLEKKLSEGGKSMFAKDKSSVAKLDELAEAINAVYAEVGLETPFLDGKADALPYFQEFNAICGFDANNRNVIDDAHGLPLSPYDPAYRASSAMMDTNASVVVKGSEIASPSAIVASNTSCMVHPVDVSSGEVVISSDEAMLRTPDDMMGLSRLRWYMSEREYADIRDWVMQGFSDGQSIPDDAIRRSVAVMRELNRMGRHYTVSRDIHMGQAKLHVEGTNLDVRLIDTPQNAKYMGMAMRDGAYTYRVSSTRRNKDGQTVIPDVSPKVACDLLHFALGDSVKCADGTTLGKASRKVRMNGSRRHEYNGVYHANTNARHGMVCTYGDLVENGVTNTYGQQMLMCANRVSQTQPHELFHSVGEAEAYIADVATDARMALIEELDIDRLAAEAWERRLNPEMEIVLSDDESIARIQQSYLDVLEGRSDTLIKPNWEAKAEGIEDGTVDDLSTDEMYYSYADVAKLMDKPVEEITSYDIVKAHRGAWIDAQTFSGDIQVNGVDDTSYAKVPWEDGINVSGISKWAQGSTSSFYISESLIEALRVCGADPTCIMDSGDFYNETIRHRLIQTGETHPMARETSPFMKTMYGVISDALSENGIVNTDIQIDDNGIVVWSGDYFGTESKDQTRRVTGTIGQIFDRDERGLVTTKFSGENYCFTPTWQASIVAPKPFDDSSVEARTRLVGYEQAMARAIRYQIRKDTLDVSQANDMYVKGSPTSLEHVYRELMSTRYDIGFDDKMVEAGTDCDIVNDIIKTQAARVRYANDIRDGSTMFAETYAAKAKTDPIINDTHQSPWNITGGRNMAIIADSEPGYFDMDISNATSTNQGIVRYLNDDVVVKDDGMMVKGAEDGMCAIKHNDMYRYLDFNPFDRQNMSVSNVFQAETITKPVGIACMTFGGYTMDDPIVVSKDFAEKYGIVKDDGTRVPLHIGDKISDLYGNKGVISLVIDPDMSDEEAKARGIEAQVKVFKDNPDLDVVMAPFSAVSRFNGGTYRELSEDTQDLVLEDGVVKGGIGHARIIVTDKTAEAKTHVYGQDEYASGLGRSASAQLAWALCSKDATHIMDEFYGPNKNAFVKLREHLIACGMNIDSDGTMSVGYTPSAEDGRYTRTFEDDPLVYREVKGDTKLDIKAMRDNFTKTLSRRGGFMELPFPLIFDTGEETPENASGRYMMPVLSAKFRSGTDLASGISTTHDYTRHYMAIFEKACQYRDLEERLDSIENAVEAESIHAQMDKLSSEAQLRFSAIQADIERRIFTGKHNIFRSDIMSRRLPHSATAVWTADPTLSIDTVLVSKEIADTIGLKDGDTSLIWRDPILRDAGIAAMKVKISDEITGIAVNPVIDKPFEGDFDGDTIGIVKLNTKSAINEAVQKFSIANNLRDRGVDNGFALQDSLDIKVAESLDADIKTQMESAIDFAKNAKTGDEKALAVDKLNDAYKACFDATVGKASLAFDTPEHYMETLKEACIDTGAKGSLSKLKDYGTWVGMDIDDTGRVVDVDNKTHATRESQKNVQYACAVKSHGTGVAGAYSQRAMSALRNVCPTAALEITKPVTQSTLQSKHDAEPALRKYNLMQGPLRAAWNGAVVEHTGEDSWKVSRPKEGVDVEAWIESMDGLFKAKDGLDVPYNRAYLEEVASVLTDANGKVMGIESPEICERKSTLDTLAYGNSGPFAFTTLVDAAEQHKNIYDGAFGEHFKPRALGKENARLEASDVASDYTQKVCGNVSVSPNLGYKEIVKAARTVDENDIVDDSVHVEPEL